MSHCVSQRVCTALRDLAFLALKLRRRGVRASKKFLMPNIKQKFLLPRFYIGKVNAMIAWRSAMVILLRFYPTSVIVAI